MPRFDSFCTMYSHAQWMGNSKLANMGPLEFYAMIHKMYRKQAEEQKSDPFTTMGNIMNARQEDGFYRLRKPSYQVYAAMAQALAETKISIPSEELHAPYPVFQIQLEAGAMILAPESILPFTPDLEPPPLVGKPYAASILVSLRNTEKFSTPHGGTILEGIAGLPEMAVEVAKEGYPTPPLLDVANALSEHGVLPDQMLSCEISIGDTENPDYVKHGSYARFGVALIHGRNISEGVRTHKSYDYSEYSMNNEDEARLSRLVVGVMFIAISKDRKWIKRTRIKLRGRDYCLCGSDKRFKKCCGNKRNKKGQGISRDGLPIGFAVGQGINLPRRDPAVHGVQVEGRGRELEYAHPRCGHMRWQPYNDDEGHRQRKLIFISPMIVRSDLQLKPQTTPHRIR